MRDGHIHSPYCPHGSSDSFEQYIKKAIEVGVKVMTFTEHLPLPKNFNDPSPENDSAMSEEHLIASAWLSLSFSSGLPPLLAAHIERGSSHLN